MLARVPVSESQDHSCSACAGEPMAPHSCIRAGTFRGSADPRHTEVLDEAMRVPASPRSSPENVQSCRE